MLCACARPCRMQIRRSPQTQSDTQYRLSGQDENWSQATCSIGRYSRFGNEQERYLAQDTRPRGLIVKLHPPKLRTFIITLILMVIIPSMALMLYAAWQHHKTARDLAQQQLIGLVQVITAEQNQSVNSTRQLLMRLSQLQITQDPAKASQCHQYLGDLLNLYPHYTNLGVVDANGVMYCSALPMDRRITIRDRLYFKQTMASHGFGIGEYQVGRVTGTPAINFSYPLFDKQGRIKGATFAALSLRWLWNLIIQNNLPQETSLRIIDSTGHILAHYPFLGKYNGESIAGTPLYQHLQRNRAKGSAVISDKDNIRRFYAYSPLINSNSGVYIAAGVPEINLADAVDKQFMQNIFMLILLSVAISSIAWVFSRTLFLQRIQILIATAGKLRDGNLGIHSGLEYANDELGYLAQAFDSMSESLQSHQRKLELTDVELKRTNRALKTLSACNKTLILATTVNQLVNLMCNLIVKVGGYRAAWIGVARGNAHNDIEILTHAGLSQAQLDCIMTTLTDNNVDDGPFGTVMHNDQMVILRNAEASTCSNNLNDQTVYFNCESMIAIPFDFDNKVGILTIYAQENDAFEENETRLLNEMADDIAYGVHSLGNSEKQLQAEARIHHLAYYDPLTDLPNRLYLENTLTDLVQETTQSLAILFVNINRFNEINNTIGYNHADDLLKLFGPRISERLPNNTFVSRTGGDIFAVLLPNCQHYAALNAAREIQIAFEEAFVISGLDLDISVTIGISLFPDHGVDAITLVRRASLAMHAAKHAPNAIFTYDSRLDQDGPRRLTLATELRRAIEGGPKVDLKTHRIISAEALCRWNHSEYGVISPVEFIPLAEHTGLITPLTLYVLHKTIALLHEWHIQDIHLPIAVNLSARNLQHPGLVQYIQSQCDEYLIPMQMLELELTESDLMNDPLLCHNTLKDLHNLGIALHIDDFGTGYSSLSYIKQLPMSAIKIDKSFILDMQSSPDAETIVKSTIAMAHQLSMLVIAEGVETREIYNTLVKFGCDQAQGFYITRPLPSKEFLPWVKQSTWDISYRPEAERNNKTGAPGT